MHSPTQLFYTRLKNNYNYQMGIVRTVIDWVVWLYILLPVLGIVGYNYVSLWQGQAEWGHALSPLILPSLLFAYVFLGNIRLFVESGDQLFLRQFEDWYKGILAKGVHYSFIRDVCSSALLFLFLAPLWLVYQEWTYVQYGLLWIVVILARLIFALGKDLLHLHFHRWRRIVIVFLAESCGLGTLFGIIYAGAMYPWILIVAVFTLAPCVYLLYNMRLAIAWSFDEDVTAQQARKMRLASFLLATSVSIGGPLIKRRKKHVHSKRALLFRRSNRLFKKRTLQNIVIEAHLKYMLRDRQRVLYYVQITSVCAAAIVLVPVWLQWGMSALSIYIFLHFCSSIWREMVRESFLRMFPTHAFNQPGLARMSIFVSALPGTIITSMVSGFVLFSTAGVFVLLVPGIGASYLMARHVIVPHTQAAFE